MSEMRENIEMKGVSEYCEKMPVELCRDETTGGRWAVKALNEAGYNSTEVDVLQLVAWLRERRPDLLAEQAPENG